MLPRLLALALLLATAGSVSAQIPEVPPPSQEEIRGMMAMARQMMNPAAQLLTHRAELELTPAQVAALDSLAPPMDRYLEEAMTSQAAPPMAVTRAMAPGGGEIDEEAIRAAYREQADRQAEIVIRRARMERQVAEILTPAQREKRQTLMMNAAFEMMRAMGNAASPPAP